MFPDTFEITGFAIGLVSFLYALYQGSEKKRLEKFVRSQNWHLYSKANNANGALQLAIEKYKSAHCESPSSDVIEWLSKADAFGQDVFKDVVRQIQLSEPRFDESQVQGWIERGKISEHHARELFRKILVDE